MDAYYLQNQRGSDCHGHGTHVASLAAGLTSGAAPRATVYSVRVLDCGGRGSASVIISGISYAVYRIKSLGRPAVISMSLGGPKQRCIDEAVARAWCLGVTVVAAAGNSYHDDACKYSPAGSPFAITVGATTQADVLASFSNIGTCVDIYAPGHLVPGAGFPCPQCIKSLSGTSMATPLVSGAAAMILQQQPYLTPDQVKELLIYNSLKYAVKHSYWYLPNNRLLHNPSKCKCFFVNPIPPPPNKCKIYCPLPTSTSPTSSIPPTSIQTTTSVTVSICPTFTASPPNEVTLTTNIPSPISSPPTVPPISTPARHSVTPILPTNTPTPSGNLRG